MASCKCVAVVLGLSTLLWGSFANAQCTKDTDCKGDRVCRTGACEDPLPAAPANPPNLGQPITPTAAPTAEVVAHEPSRLRSPSGYASVASLVSIHSWVGDSHENVGYGGYAAGYWAANPLFHLGGYFHASMFTGESRENGSARPFSRDGGHFGVGVSTKIGGSLSDFIWLGSAIDLGAHIAIGSNNKVGVEVFPRLEIDVQLGQSGRLKTGLFASFGPMLATGLTDYMQGSSGSIAALQLLAGFLVGG
jgi:hypothetical protein